MSDSRGCVPHRIEGRKAQRTALFCSPTRNCWAYLTCPEVSGDGREEERSKEMTVARRFNSPRGSRSRLQLGPVDLRHCPLCPARPCSGALLRRFLKRDVVYPVVSGDFVVQHEARFSANAKNDGIAAIGHGKLQLISSPLHGSVDRLTAGI